jgi:hypothetical protein
MTAKQDGTPSETLGETKRVAAVISVPAYNAMDLILLHYPATNSRLIAILLEAALIQIGALNEDDAPLAKFIPELQALIKSGQVKEV